MTNRTLAVILRDQQPLQLAAERSVQDACRAMWERGAGSVLVVEGSGRLCGIFTGRDVIRLIAAGSAVPHASPLADAMTRDPLTIRPTARAVDAIRAMTHGGFRHVPVTEHDCICGIVSRSDLRGMELEECVCAEGGVYASAVERTLGDIVASQTPVVLGPGDTIAVACERMLGARAGSTLVAGDGGGLAGIFTGRDAVRSLAQGRAGDTSLADAMTAKPVALPPEAAAIEALRIMSDLGFRHVPVIDRGRILGVVSRSDFTGCEIDRLDEDERLRECIW